MLRLGNGTWREIAEKLIERATYPVYALGWLRGPATPRKRHSLILPYRFELIHEVAA
jgi:hypothetical protein